jgi:acyl-CoA thioesterase-1
VRARGSGRARCGTLAAMAGVVAARRAARLLGLALVALVGSGAPRASAAGEEGPLRVMALGDSVTVGTGSSHGGGYRMAFWERMREVGETVDMVGGKANGPDTFDNRHQGYPSISVYDLSARVYDKVRSYRPDVVLLLVGTDEVTASGFSRHAFGPNLEVMIDRIFIARPEAKLLISTIPPTKYGRHLGAKLALNEVIKRVVRKRAAEGQEVYLVDSFPLIDQSRDMADSHHPNDAGYERIGRAFADRLLQVMGEEPIE